MKGFGVFAVIASLSLFLVVNSCDAKDKVIDFGQTPAATQSFIKQHFQGVEVLYVELDNDGYEVYLSNGFNVDFDRKGEWEKVDGNKNVMVKSIIDLLPVAIPNYIDKNYSGRQIEKIKKQTGLFKNYYEVELLGDPDIELEFDKEGNFKRIDY